MEQSKSKSESERPKPAELGWNGRIPLPPQMTDPPRSTCWRRLVRNLFYNRPGHLHLRGFSVSARQAVRATKIGLTLTPSGRPFAGGQLGMAVAALLGAEAAGTAAHRLF